MCITETRSVEIFSSFHILYCLSNDYLQSSSSTYLLQSYSSKQVILQFSFIVIWILNFFLLCTLSNLSCDPPNVKKGLFYFHYYLVAYVQIKKAFMFVCLLWVQIYLIFHYSYWASENLYEWMCWPLPHAVSNLPGGVFKILFMFKSGGSSTTAGFNLPLSFSVGH